MKIFWSFARQAFSTTAIYRFDFWLRVVYIFLMMYSAYWLWTILYRQDPAIVGVDLEQMISYGIMAMVIEIVFRPGNGLMYYLTHQVKTGAIVMDVLKPLDFPMHMFARNMGETAFVTVMLAVPSLIIGSLFLGLHLPPTWQNGLMFFLSIVLAYLVLFSMSLILGLVSFFTIDIRNIGWAYNAIWRFFSGQYVPLWIFPAWLANIANVLPFRCVYAIPLSIYIGRFSFAEAWQAMGLQALWTAALLMAGRAMWATAYRRLVVQGG